MEDQLDSFSFIIESMQNEIDEKTKIIHELERTIAQIMKERNASACDCRQFAKSSERAQEILAVERLLESLADLTSSIFSEGFK